MIKNFVILKKCIIFAPVKLIKLLSMGKKLAIKGHQTRGNEVIELLKMMGGKNTKGYIGIDYDEIYTIEDGYIIESYDWNDYLILSLEEFLEKYPFKVGDKFNYKFYTIPITVKSMSWCEDYCTMVYDFVEVDDVFAAEDLLKWNMIPINKENKMKTVLAELLEHIKTTPKEELEREFEELEEWSNVGPTVEEFMDFCNKVNKKPKYPDNYEECVRIAKNIHGYDIHIDVPAYGELMESFVKLLICRDAYWKIAGEEMGLGKPWEPDWKNSEERRYCIVNIEGDINLHEKILTKWILKVTNKILVFPTEEMRDIFYKNFKDLIEECKELL